MHSIVYHTGRKKLPQKGQIGIIVSKILQRNFVKSVKQKYFTWNKKTFSENSGIRLTGNAEIGMLSHIH